MHHSWLFFPLRHGFVYSHVTAISSIDTIILVGPHGHPPTIRRRRDGKPRKIIGFLPKKIANMILVKKKLRHFTATK